MTQTTNAVTTRSAGAGDGPTTIDAVVVGAGFAGLHALHSLRASGFTTMLFEAGDGVGGTWFWNRYPGARCDANSLFYCYSFSDEVRAEWTWTQRYPERDELVAYLDFVADRLDLRRDIRLSTRVRSATYLDAEARWEVVTDSGDLFRCRFLVLAVGCLSTAQLPALEGIGQFAGQIVHTARWPAPSPDVTGRRVAVLGTGSSAVQVIPRLAAQGADVYVFQRTANYVFPARNAPLDPEVVADVQAHYPELREKARRSAGGMPNDPPTLATFDVDDAEREAAYQERWDIGGATEFLGVFTDLRTDDAANAAAAAFIRSKIGEVVTDPDVARTLMPTIPLGAKRPQVGTDYYETFNLPRVHLVDIAPPRRLSLTPDALVVHDPSGGSQAYPADMLVAATGFDAFTGSLLAIDIRGRDGERLADHWRDGPRTYLGLAVAGFPNMFVITGPGSPSVLGNVPVATEQHVEWLDGLLGHVVATGSEIVEATPEAEKDWTAHVDEVGAGTVLASGDSWYVGANVPGKPRTFLPYAGGYGAYRTICDEVAHDGYRGFVIR